ncbi:UNVERIFIED_CONTAM: hypothetical protein PYX00_007118 [Menopon gallinae]|uniref:Nucleolar complex protein 3 homolog n=1 Tax=Menopon gallinae TaxID=328185 RepID=A0AAW2HHS1_9NEOP
MAKKKGKVSSVKRSNQRQTKLKKQGKLKKRHNRKKVKFIKRRRPAGETQKKIDPVEEEEQKREEEYLAEQLRSNYTADSFEFLAKVNLERDNRSSRRQKRKLKQKQEEEEAKNVELKYEETAEPPEAKKTKYLLPIKTSEGIVPRSVDVEEEIVEEEEEEKEEQQDKESINDEEEEEKKKSGKRYREKRREYTNAELLARRQNALRESKFRIGVLCSGLLESPEEKIGNFKPLLDMLTDVDPEVCITVKKLALVSLLEIFKDILPEYQIRIHDDPKVKLKKDVKILRDYESGLLNYYKSYLQKIESLMVKLKRKMGQKFVVEEAELNLAIMALKCLCDLLVAYPYFNFAKNIVQLIVPHLNHRLEKVRDIVSNAVREVFKTDKRGEITLNIVRCINKLVKSKNNSVFPDTIQVFLSLRIKDVDLDKEKEEELQKKKLNAKKHNILKLSKRERKRKKRLQDLEKELLETKASENKEKKQEYLTEITKLVFMIYFKILKVTPSSKLLKAALEGLARFAHCINVEFYHDLVNALDNLIENEDLGFKEKLCCVHTVFTILFYQGATIYLDPSRFYSHLYSTLLYLNAGTSHNDIPLVLKAADVVLLKRRKYVSLQRLLAFTKRLSLMTLQVLPNGALALLNIIREILQVNSSTDVLLDVDASIGQGIYYPEMDEPEYCNAGVSSLWELLPLQRHYHPTVQEYSKLVAGISHTGEKSSQYKNFLKMGSEELYKVFDPSEVKFNPAVPAPKKFPKNKGSGKTILNDSLQDYIKKALSEEDFEW